MRRVLALLLLVACSSSPASLCDDVVCGEGSTCSEVDGLCHCGAAEGAVCGDAEVCEAGACVEPLPEPSCVTPTPWSPGMPAFVEATDAWGLRGIEGVRLNVADVDGDGLTDLLVRRGGQGADGFGAEDTRRTWLLRNTGDGFVDVTQASGLLARRDGTVGRPVEIAAFADVDGDGDLDAYLGVSTRVESAGTERPAIFLNDGAGNFVLGPESDLTDTILHAPAGASFVDFDRDGVLDLFVPQHNATGSGGGTIFLWDRLYRGDGTGAFVEVTEERGMMTEDWNDLADLDAARAHSRAWASLARDLDGDGLAELLVPSYGRAPNHLWHARLADGVVSYENRSIASGFAFDADQTWQDNQFARCFCASNRAAEGCADVPSPAISCSPNWSHDQDRRPFRLGGNSAQVSAGDVDNDGDLDLLTGEIKHWWAGAGSDGGQLLVNDGSATFTRIPNAESGLAVDHGARTDWDEGHMTNALFDFDGDGRLDVYVGASDYPGNRGHLYRNEGGLRFVELATADFFEHNRSHGVVVADFDRDGDLDVIVGHSRARCGPPNDCYETSSVRAFENVTPASNWVQVRLVGEGAMNRGAIGAQLRVDAGGLTRVLEVDGGSGHYGSQEDLVQTIGLGAACEATITVRWPDAAGTTETFVLPAGHRFELRPGTRPRVVP